MKQKVEKISCKAMYATELLWHLAEVDSSLSVESNLNVVWSIIIIQVQAGVVNKCLEKLRFFPSQKFNNKKDLLSAWRDF